MSDPARDHPLFVAIAELLEAVGGAIIEADALAEGDIPVTWEGSTIGGVRLGSLDDALDRMVDKIEAELGADLTGLGRTDKQRAVRMLDEQGAFLLRKSIEDIAERMGVSRITIYNYLNAIRDEPERRTKGPNGR
jgi:AcrR family transcriptional regulator